MPVELRTIVESELAAYQLRESAAFGDPTPTLAGLASDASVLELDRTLAGFDGEQLVATASAFSMMMTVPGGGFVPVAGVTGVSVAATHRRRGVLRAMMAMQLDDVADRGEPLAVLNASEAGIYRRFGYGLAQFFQRWSIDTVRATLRPPTPAAADVGLRMVPRADAAEVLAPIYDSWRGRRAGALTHSPAWWGGVLADHHSWRGGGPLFVVVADPVLPSVGDPGHAGGYALYTIDNDHPGGHWVLALRDLVAADPVVHEALWRFILGVDLVGVVKAEAGPVDDPLRWLLTDPRQVRTTAVQDFLHVRILDVAAALTARRYPVADDLVLHVHDSFRPDTDGRYRVAGGGSDAVEVQRLDGSAAPADLELDMAVLGSLYLGGVSAIELAAAGRLVEHRPGAVRRAEAFFRWPVAPFCVTRF